MSATGLDITKAGWLYRQSSVLHRWKRNWFALYRDGLLRYFESQESPRAEEVFVLRAVCARIRTGPEVGSTSPPEGVSQGKTCMLQLDMRDGDHLVLCAESPDDMKAWQISLEEARTTQPHAPPPPGAVGYPVTQTVPMVSYVPGGPVAYQYGTTSYSAFGYGGYPGQVISPAPPQVIQTPNGTTTVVNPVNQVLVVGDDLPRHRRYHRGYRTGTVQFTSPYYW